MKSKRKETIQMKRIVKKRILTALILLFAAGSIVPAWANTDAVAITESINRVQKTADGLSVSLNVIWVLITGFLVFFMQAGFALQFGAVNFTWPAIGPIGAWAHSPTTLGDWTGLLDKPLLHFGQFGILAGLVAITAPCAFVSTSAAAVIGLVAGVIVCLVTFDLEKLHIDDPVGLDIPEMGLKGYIHDDAVMHSGRLHIPSVTFKSLSGK
jgi:hypothetical protein